jgi:magnesium transporter
MQRYAHIRLIREWEEKERIRKGRKGSYGTNQAAIAEERAKANLTPRYNPPQHAEYRLEEEGEALDRNGDDEHLASESDPLIASLPPTYPHSRPRHSPSRPSIDTATSSSAASSRAEAAFKQKSYLHSPYWWSGIIMMTVGEAGNFLAYGFAPASIVSPLGVVALISNCIIAPFVLKEPFRKRDGLGVFIAVTGAVTVVLSASDNNPKLGPGEIWKLIGTWEFETYLGITVAVIIGLMAASNKYGGKSIFLDLGLVGLFGECILTPSLG